jgi:poly(A) polymerase Pap1
MVIPSWGGGEKRPNSVTHISTIRSGLVESKLRQIVAKLEVMELILLAHPYIKGMDKVHYITADEKGDATRGIYPLDRTFQLEEGSMETDYFKKIKETGVWPDDKMDDLSPLYTTTFYIGLSIQRKSSKSNRKVIKGRVLTYLLSDRRGCDKDKTTT